MWLTLHEPFKSRHHFWRAPSKWTWNSRKKGTEMSEKAEWNLQIFGLKFFTHSLKSDLSHFEYYLAIIWEKPKCHLVFKVAQMWLFVFCLSSFVCCDAGLISSWMNFSQCYLPFSSFVRSNQSASHCFFFLRLYFSHITWSHGHNASVFRNQPGAFVRSVSPLALNSGEWSVFLF